MCIPVEIISGKKLLPGESWDDFSGAGFPKIKILGKGELSDDEVNRIATERKKRGEAEKSAQELYMRAVVERLVPRVTVVSTTDAIRQVDERLSYFRQLAVILGAVSLLVGFLLVTTLMTVSVNERIGEIAVMRAIGVRRERIVAQIVVEAGTIMLVAAPLGLALGLVTARYLNSILARFPGLPERIDFFLFQPSAAWTALGLLVLSGILSGIYPSWRSASLGIAPTLRQEAVG